MKKTILFFLVIVLDVLCVWAQDISELLSQAQDFYEQGNYQAAILKYTAVISKDPNNKQAIMELGDSFLAMGDTSEAVSFFKKAIDLYPNDLEGYRRLAYFYFYSNKFQESFDVLRKAYLKNQENPKAKALYAVGYLIYGKEDSTKILVDQLLKDKIDPQAFLILAEGYASLEKYEKSIDFINKAIEIDSLNDLFFYLRSEYNLQLDKLDQALFDINKAIDLNPRKIDYYLALLSIYYSKQDFFQASKKGKELFYQVRDSNFYILVITAMWYNNEPIDTIIKYLDEAIARIPAGSLWYLKGYILKENAKYDDAVIYFKKALDKDPWDVDYTKEYILARLIANSKGLNEDLYFKNYNSFNLKKLKNGVKRKKSKYNYFILLDKLSQDPLSLDLEEYLHLYVGVAIQKDYNPKQREKSYYYLDSLLEKKKYNDLIVYSYKLLNNDPSNIAVYYFLSVVFYGLGNLEEFRENYAKYLGFVMAIRGTGDGQTRNTALLSACSIDEIKVLYFLGYDQIFSERVEEQYKGHFLKKYFIARDGQMFIYYFLTDLYKKRK